MNKRQMTKYAEEHGCIYNRAEMERRMARLGTRLTRFDIFREAIVNANTGEPMYLFYDRVNGKYIDINFDECVHIEENRFLTLDEFNASHQISIFNNSVEEENCFTEVEERIIKDVVQRLNLNEVKPYGFGDRIYNRIGVLRDGDDDNSYTMGFELEVNLPTFYSSYGAGSDCSHILNTKLGHLERDSSISGVEFDNHIFTWNKLKKAKPLFERQLQTFCENGFIASSGAGLHIHIGRNAFVNDTALKRFYFLINCRNLYSSWKIIARREESTFAEYSRLEEGNLEHLRRSMNYHEQHHSRAVNQEHSSTIEVRIFQSTLSVGMLYDTLELMVKLVEFCNNTEDVIFNFEKVLTSSDNTIKKQLQNLITTEDINLAFINPMSRERCIELMQQALANGDIELSMSYASQLQQQGGAR